MWNTGSWASGLATHWLLEHRLNSAASRSMRDLPRSGIKRVSATLVGGFFTTEPPGKPDIPIFAELSEAASYSDKTTPGF